jgi:hypothetical protein
MPHPVPHGASHSLADATIFITPLSHEIAKYWLPAIQQADQQQIRLYFPENCPGMLVVLVPSIRQAEYLRNWQLRYFSNLAILAMH